MFSPTVPTHSRRAFSLVELAVVVAVVGILGAIAIPTFLGHRSSAHDASAKLALRSALTTDRFISEFNISHCRLSPTVQDLAATEPAYNWVSPSDVQREYVEEGELFVKYIPNKDSAAFEADLMPRLDRGCPNGVSEGLELIDLYGDRFYTVRSASGNCFWAWAVTDGPAVEGVFDARPLDALFESETGCWPAAVLAMTLRVSNRR